MTNSGRYWTHKDLKRLREYALAGKTDAEIGELLGRSQHAVFYKRKHTLGIDYRKHWTEEEDARLARLLTATDAPLSEIAKQMNRTQSSIERRKERLGIHRVPFKLDRSNPVQVAQLIKFKMAGYTQKEIANMWGIKNPSQISYVLQSHGLHRFYPRVGKRVYRRWSDLEVQQLRKCVKRKMLLSEIYREFPHRSPSSIASKVRAIRQEVSLANETIAIKREAGLDTVEVKRAQSVGEMRDMGLTIDTIAELKGLTRVEVFQQVQGSA